MDQSEKRIAGSCNSRRRLQCGSQICPRKIVGNFGVVDYIVRSGEKVDQMHLAKDLSVFNDTHLLDLRPEVILSIESNPFGTVGKYVFRGTERSVKMPVVPWVMTCGLCGFLGDAFTLETQRTA